MDLNIIDLSGKSTKKITSTLFDEPYRPDLIKKAVLGSSGESHAALWAAYVCGNEDIS